MATKKANVTPEAGEPAIDVRAELESVLATLPEHNQHTKAIKLLYSLVK